MRRRIDVHDELFKPLFRKGRLRPYFSVDTAGCDPEDSFLSIQAIAETYRLAGCDRSFELAVLSGYGVVFANCRNRGVVCLGDGFFIASH